MIINQEQLQYGQIKKIVDQTIGFCLQNFSNNKISFPLFKNTFSMWRKLAYQFMKANQNYHNAKKYWDFNFYILSEVKYLKEFLKKVQYPNKNEEEINQLYKKYQQLNKHQLLQLFNDLLWQHTIYCELMMDIIKLPYLGPIFNLHKDYKLKNQFLQISTVLTNENNSREILQNVSKNLITKSISQIMQKVFTKTFLIKASSIAIRLNPLAMAASFAFSQLLTSYRQDSKQKQMIAQIKQQIQKCYKNLLILRQNFQIIIISLLPRVIKEDQEAIEQFKKKILEILEQDWLEVIKLDKDQEGWEVIILQGNPQKK